MSRIAFCWELGRGFGHLTPYLALIRRLIARGDEVFFLAKETQSALDVFTGLPVEVIELRPGFTAPAERIVAVDSYPEILNNWGFHDADPLHRRVCDVAEIISNIGPDVLVTDFAPTVMLANVSLGLPIIAAGSGFHVPLRSTPMPRFRYWQGRAGAAFVRNEDRVLEVINRVLAWLERTALTSIAELLRTDREWLTTFPELDCYGARDGANYLGTFPVEGFGQPPVWPSNGEQPVFAYLLPGSTAIAALHTLQSLGAALCLYAPELSPTETAELEPNQLSVMTELVDITRVAGEAKLFVHNGNLNTMAAGLLAGMPQLAIPTTAERYLNARRLELLGAGLAAPHANPGDIPAKLKALLSDPQYSRAASRFADKYRDDWLGDHTRAMIEDIDRFVDV